MSDLVRPYVRDRIDLLYTPQDPPPREPPGWLRMPHPGIWRVAAGWWYAHQPDAGGRICRECHRWWPCDTLLTADGIFRTAIRRARGTARGVASVLYPRNRNV